MKIDLKELRETISKEVEETKSNSSGSSNDIKILYPYQDGKLTLRLLYNLKGKVVQRKIIRHEAGKGKVPCLQVYGQECPVCKAINEVESVKGKECGAFGKYGYKTKGVCYAQVVDASDGYLKGEGSISKGEIVLFMYPKSMYEHLNKIMLDSADHLGDIVAQNNSIPVVIDRSTKKGGFPEYVVSLYPFGASKAFEDTNEKTGDQLYEEMLEGLPNILEDFVPNYPNDDVYKNTRALADTIIEEYMNSNITNPGDVDREEPKTEQKDEAGSIADSVAPAAPVDPTTPDSQNESNDSGDLECFGRYDQGSRKCMLCLKEVECMKASSGK